MAPRDAESVDTRVDRRLHTTPHVDGHNDLMIRHHGDRGGGLNALDGYDIGVPPEGPTDIAP